MPNQLARGRLLQEPEILVVLHAITQVLPAYGIDGAVEAGRLIAAHVTMRRVEKPTVAVAPVTDLARFLVVAGLVAHGISPWILQFGRRKRRRASRSEEHTSELQSRQYLVCR